MNTKKSESRSSSSTQYEHAPWDVAIHPLREGTAQLRSYLEGSGLSDVEQQALGGLLGNAQDNPFASQIGALASDLFGSTAQYAPMIQNALNQFGANVGQFGQNVDQFRGDINTYQQRLDPYVNLDTNPYSNEAFTRAVGGLTDDIMNKIRSQYVAAGYDPVGAGDYAKVLGEGISRGVAPAWLDAFMQLEGLKTGAIDKALSASQLGYGAGQDLYRAGQDLFSAQTGAAGILSAMDQQAIQNRIAGIEAANAAINARNQPFNQMLAIESMRQSIPVDRVQDIMGTLMGVGQLGGSGRSDTQTFKSASETGSVLDTIGRAVGIGTQLFGTGGAPGLGGMKWF